MLNASIRLRLIYIYEEIKLEQVLNLIGTMFLCLSLLLALISMNGILGVLQFIGLYYFLISGITFVVLGFSLRVLSVR